MAEGLSVKCEKSNNRNTFRAPIFVDGVEHLLSTFLVTLLHHILMLHQRDRFSRWMRGKRWLDIGHTRLREYGHDFDSGPGVRLSCFS